MMTVMDLARIDTRLSRVCSNEYAGPCPGCSGTDRFHVKLTKRDGQGGFMCRYCWPAEEKGWGDSIDYLRHFKQLSYQAAREELGIQEKTYAPSPTSMTHNTAPIKTWQETGRALCHAAQQCLWSRRGEAGLAYLHGRGFTDATIREAMLGYCPGLSMAGEQWGIQTKQLVIPKGIVIPWYSGGQLWKITLRLGKSADHRYEQVLGSQECLYNADSISSDKITVLYEGAFDALSGQQVAPEFAHVATDDTRKCHQARWIARLCLASRVLVAYDAEESGDIGASFWTRTLPHASRWRPWAKDANVMLEQGLDLLEWLVLGLA